MWTKKFNYEIMKANFMPQFSVLNASKILPNKKVKNQLSQYCNWTDRTWSNCN